MLGIMDGLKGLEMVFKEEFPQAKVQRCQVHVARNFMAKMPKKLKPAVAEDMRSTFLCVYKGKGSGILFSVHEEMAQGTPFCSKVFGARYRCLFGFL